MTTTLCLNGKTYECEVDWWFDLGDICFQLIEARDEDGEKVDEETFDALKDLSMTDKEVKRIRYEIGGR